MADNKTSHTDEGLQDNEQIEQAILALQQQPSQEMLAHALTVLRRRMLAHGQLIVAVEPPVGDNQMRLQAIQTDDGKKWWAAFTSFWRGTKRRRQCDVYLSHRYRKIISLRPFGRRNRRSDHQSLEPDADA